MLKRSTMKNKAAVALGRLGGRVGGIARALKLTAEERSAIARRGAQARWHREKFPPPSEEKDVHLKGNAGSDPGNVRIVEVDPEYA